MTATKENAPVRGLALPGQASNSSVAVEKSNYFPRRCDSTTAAGRRQDVSARYDANDSIFQQAKERVSVPEAARRLGLEPNSAGKIRCFIHNGDNTPSLHLYEKNWNCYGCGEHGDVTDFVSRYRGIGKREAAQWLLGEESPISSTTAPEPPKPKAAPDYGVFEREHVYTNGTKKVFYRLKDGSKRAVWYHQNGEHWAKSRGNAPHVLYERGSHNGDVFVVEGEKDAENLASLYDGLIYAVSGENGAGHGKWLSEYTEQLKAAGVKAAVIFSDNDDIGREYAQETAATLATFAESVKVLDLRKVWPECPEHEDISDLIFKFGKAAAKTLIQTLYDDTPEWTPPEPMEQPAAAQGFAPFRPFEKTAQETLPPFPWEALPEVLQNVAETLSDFAETDYALAAVPALANCAVSIGRKFLVNPKPGWREPLNLYAITAAASGDRKSSVMTPLNKPIYDFQDDFNEQQASVVAQWQDDLEITSGEIAETKRKILKGKATRDDLARLTERKRQLEQNPERPLCLFAQDCTPEELEQLLSENRETLSFICSEGGIIETMTGKRYSDGVNLEALLNSYTGDTVKVDRIGRPKVYLRRPCLNINVMAQPVTVQEMISTKTFNRRGLNGRFLYAFPPSRVGSRSGDRPEPMPEVMEDYNNLIHALLELKPDMDEKGRDTPRVIRFSPEAMESRLEFFRECESLLRDIDPESPFMTWAKRMEAHAVRLSGILHICEYRDDADKVPLSAETFQQAVTLTRYFKAHAEYAFSLSGASESPEEADARYIWKRIQESGQTEISKRNLLHRCRRFKDHAENMEPGLNELVTRGYVRVEERRTDGRPAVTVHVNPETSQQN